MSRGGWLLSRGTGCAKARAATNPQASSSSGKTGSTSYVGADSRAGQRASDSTFGRRAVNRFSTGGPRDGAPSVDAAARCYP
jgi:hypothetical protein